jgi:NADP-dependent 3-hydroxy acid dehydrogenase YdfG
MATGPVLITGCSSGIGYATAERLLSDGRRVYASARRPETLDALKANGAITPVRTCSSASGGSRPTGSGT